MENVVSLHSFYITDKNQEKTKIERRNPAVRFCQNKELLDTLKKGIFKQVD